MWSFAHAARRGAVHSDGEGQDRFAVHCDGDTVALCVSDGAGSARLGGRGAEVACSAFLKAFTPLAKRRKKIIDEEVRTAFSSVRVALGEEALDLGVELDELSCTLVGAVVTPREALFLQLGDGAGVVDLGDRIEVAIWPEGSEVVNETSFLTGVDAEKRLMIRRTKPPRGVALFTDGIQYLVLDHATQQPHQPFFETLFRQLEKAAQLVAPGAGKSATSGESKPVSQWIDAMLASPMVTTKTDDDTCLVVARRMDG
ncbi:MAG: protein phosphatase 2C domain-containing protein [Fimbriimonadaceae bacterium]|nr:protein phosphatase 2C domain-containing protein [Fimbriimonadaceae bacterium]